MHILLTSEKQNCPTQKIAEISEAMPNILDFEKWLKGRATPWKQLSL